MPSNVYSLILLRTCLISFLIIEQGPTLLETRSVPLMILTLTNFDIFSTLKTQLTNLSLVHQAVKKIKYLSFRHAYTLKEW